MNRCSQCKTDWFPQQMGRSSDILRAGRFGDGHIAERIKKFDRQLQFFVKKLLEAKRGGPSTGEKDAFWRFALLLGAIVTDRTHHFRVEPRHGAARSEERRVGKECRSR